MEESGEAGELVCGREEGGAGGEARGECAGYGAAFGLGAGADGEDGLGASGEAADDAVDLVVEGGRDRDIGGEAESNGGIGPGSVASAEGIAEEGGEGDKLFGEGRVVAGEGEDGG
jgi:hypothetical protein